MKPFDKNQFLLLATAIGAATVATGSKVYPPDDGEKPEQDQAVACDGDTGQTGRAKYCPISEGQRKGCLDWAFCDDSTLKAASELRLFDCLAHTPARSCVAEGGPTTNPYLRCAQQVVNHACADGAAAATCQRVERACRGSKGSLMSSCTTYVTPMTAAGRTAFASCMVEGCDDYQFMSCTQYMR